jgi:hypothetical protein
MTRLLPILALLVAGLAVLAWRRRVPRDNVIDELITALRPIFDGFEPERRDQSTLRRRRAEALKRDGRRLDAGEPEPLRKIHLVNPMKKAGD